MSNLNLCWLATNLKSDPVVFDIGAADLYDTCRMKTELPHASFYAFECNDHWQYHNPIVAQDNQIHYFHCAVSDNDGDLVFYPSENLDGTFWPWSGSTCEPDIPLINARWNWGDKYSVKSITLNTFCEEHKIYPDFIHIDVQGAEYKVLSSINTLIRPSIIWAEISEFHMYKTGISYEQFKEMIEAKGYIEEFKDNHDALYILRDYPYAPYEKIIKN